MKRYTTPLAAVAFGALAAAPALAQQQAGSSAQQQTRQPAQQQQTTGQTASQGKNAQSAVVGQVTDTREVQISGPAGDQHKLYKLETAEGKQVIMDVGPATEQSAELQRGDLVMAIGSKARINRKPVLFARYYGPAHQAGKGMAEQGQ